MNNPDITNAVRMQRLAEIVDGNTRNHGVPNVGVAVAMLELENQRDKLLHAVQRFFAASDKHKVLRTGHALADLRRIHDEMTAPATPEDGGAW